MFTHGGEEHKGCAHVSAVSSGKEGLRCSQTQKLQYCWFFLFEHSDLEKIFTRGHFQYSGV